MNELKNLPLDLQRKLIDWCIQEQSLTINFDGNEYTLPNIIQLTYFCEECGSSYPIELYTVDLVKNRFAQAITCPNCNQYRFKAYIYHKTVPLDHVLISTFKESVVGLKKFLEDEIAE